MLSQLRSPQQKSATASTRKSFHSHNRSLQQESSINVDAFHEKLLQQQSQQQLQQSQQQQQLSNDEDKQIQTNQTSERYTTSKLKTSTATSPKTTAVSVQFSIPCVQCASNQPTIKLQQLQAERQKLNARNNDLVSELHEISSTIDTILEKNKPKRQQQGHKTQHQQQQQHSAEEVTHMELENVRQQLIIYQKRYSALVSVQSEHTSTRINQLNSVSLEIDAQLEEAKILNKNLQYLNRGSQRTMGSNAKETKLKLLRDEVVLLKNQIRTARQTAKENMTGFKKTQDHVRKLEARHKEVCLQFNVPFSPFEPLPKEAKPSLTIQETDQVTNEVVIKIVSDEEIAKLTQDVRIIEESKKSLMKSMKIDKKSNLNRLNQIEAENENLIASIELKVKEISGACEQLNMMQQQLLVLKSRSISSIPSKESGSSASSLHAAIAFNGLKSNSLHSILPSTKKYTHFRKEVQGVLPSLSSSYLPSSTIKHFDDAKQLPESKEYVIQELCFWYFDDMIMRMQTTYHHLSTGEQTTISAFDEIGGWNDMVQESRLQMLHEANECITSIEMYVSKSNIQHIQISTSRGQVLEAGSKKNAARCRKVVYEIRKNEMPVCFSGSTDRRSNQFENVRSSSNSPNMKRFTDAHVLVNLGIELRKKEATMGSSGGANSELMKLLSKQPRILGDVTAADIQLVRVRPHNRYSEIPSTLPSSPSNQSVQEDKYLLVHARKNNQQNSYQKQRHSLSGANSKQQLNSLLMASSQISDSSNNQQIQQQQHQPYRYLVSSTVGSVSNSLQSLSEIAQQKKQNSSHRLSNSIASAESLGGGEIKCKNDVQVEAKKEGLSVQSKKKETRDQQIQSEEVNILHHQPSNNSDNIIKLNGEHQTQVNRLES